MNVSRETEARLRILSDLTVKWTKKINLIAPSTVSEIWRRHIVDSAQIWPFRPDDPSIWVDIGSGGGFPGLVVSAIAHDESPATKIALIESDMRKTVFLRQAAREMGVTLEVIQARIENSNPKTPDVISARALAPVNKIFDLTQHMRGPRTKFILLKGKSAKAELEEAAETWSFKAEIHPSVTDREASILVLSDVMPRSESAI